NVNFGACGSEVAGAEPRELSLEEVLKSYEQPINEEQAWAVCYQCCSGLRVPRPPSGRPGRVKDPSSILLHRDGTVSLKEEPQPDGRTEPQLFLSPPNLHPESKQTRETIIKPGLIVFKM
uniref:KIND domain-containing protein n=1 Tax=Poecilia latipinna TaxID=48699 RepID=A0A3B3V8E8_9TELE